MERMEHLRKEFERLWEHTKDNINVEQLIQGSPIRKWWPTVKTTTPFYDALVANLADFPFNPYMSILTTYYLGYAQALEDMLEERVWPDKEEGVSRLPEWLEQISMEDVLKRYGDKH